MMISSTLSIKDQKFIDLAVKEAKYSTMEMKHGCIITKNGKFVSSGCNNHRNTFSHSVFKPNNSKDIQCSCHAEMDALYKAFKRKKCNFKKVNVLSSKYKIKNSKNYTFHSYSQKKCFKEGNYERKVR